MNFNEYQERAYTTARFPMIDEMGICYPVIGLAGETGEVSEKVKKFFRDGGDLLKFKQDITLELGDCMWYIASIAKLLGISLQDVAEGNITKVESRVQRNKIHGSGDSR